MYQYFVDYFYYRLLQLDIALYQIKVAQEMQILELFECEKEFSYSIKPCVLNNLPCATVKLIQILSLRFEQEKGGRL